MPTGNVNYQQQTEYFVASLDLSLNSVLIWGVSNVAPPLKLFISLPEIISIWLCIVGQCSSVDLNSHITLIIRSQTHASKTQEINRFRLIIMYIRSFNLSSGTVDPLPSFQSSLRLFPAEEAVCTLKWARLIVPAPLQPNLIVVYRLLIVHAAWRCSCLSAHDLNGTDDR